MKVWVIGHPEAVLGFALVGVHGIAADSVESVQRALDDALGNPELGMVLITDDCSTLVSDRMTQLTSRVEAPLFLEIPSPKGMSPGRKSFSALVEQAIGIRK